ncbi:MAG: MFS transporter [Deltaproteobacteria bacterium]|nr:MFS transporter [Deltaproteobacteria bacterium]
MQSALRTAAAGLIGNVLEWFDYAVYGYFTTEIAKTFTPSTMAQSERELIALAVFFIGFAARPIGGLVLGVVGDRIGRRALMTLSIALMGGATLLIGLLPGYSTIGIAAPVLLTLCRLLQGFSLGGEFTGSMVYTTELASPLMRGIVASSTAAGTTLGFILGSLTAWIVNRSLGAEAAAEWGWRIPFIGSVVFCVLGWFLRRGIVEPEVSAKAIAERAPILGSLVADWKPIAQTFGIVALTNAAYYLAFTFAVERRKAEDTAFQAFNTISLVVVLFAKLFGGWLSDRVGRRRLMIAITVMTMVAVYTSLRLMLFGGPTEFFIGQLLLGVPLGMALGLQGAMVVEIFPLRTRVTSMSFAYSITLALAGGLAPLISKWLIDNYDPPTLPAFYVMIYGLIGLPIMLAMRETNDRALDE